MQITNSTAILTKFDQAFDYFPGLSLINNIVDLFLKAVVLPFKDPQSNTNNHYWKHINDKSTLRCVALIILPILGNIVFAIYDFVTRFDSPNYISALCEKDPQNIKFATPRLLNDVMFLILLTKNHPNVLKHLPKEILNDKEFSGALGAVKAGSIFALEEIDPHFHKYVKAFYPQNIRQPLSDEESPLRDPLPYHR